MIPESIKAVEVTLPGGNKLGLKYNDRDTTWGYNYFEDETYTSAAPIKPGTYSFTVTDFDGNTFGPVTEVLTADDIAAAANFGLPTITAPADATVLNITTPNITWTEVAGAAYYRVRILDAYSASDVIHLSPELTGKRHHPGRRAAAQPHLPGPRPCLQGTHRGGGGRLLRIVINGPDRCSSDNPRYRDRTQHRHHPARPEHRHDLRNHHVRLGNRNRYDHPCFVLLGHAAAVGVRTGQPAYLLRNRDHGDVPAQCHRLHQLHRYLL